MRGFRGPSDSPPDDAYAPSALVEAVLSVLEDAEVPEAVNDQVVKLIETQEIKWAEADELLSMMPSDLVDHHRRADGKGGKP